jgi:hypothetical protein
MSIEVQGKVGIQELSPGAVSDLRMGRSGELISSQGHAPYKEAVTSGKVWIGANPAGTIVTTQAGLSATTPALTLFNPIGSGVNLVLQTVTIGITAAPAASATLMLAYNLANATAPATTTLANVTNALLTTNGQPIGQCYRIATLATAPIAFRYLGGTTGAAAIESTNLIDHIDGEIIIPEGVAISVQSTSEAAILASFVWEEIVK